MDKFINFTTFSGNFLRNDFPSTKIVIGKPKPGKWYKPGKVEAKHSYYWMVFIDRYDPHPEGKLPFSKMYDISEWSSFHSVQQDIMRDFDHFFHHHNKGQYMMVFATAHTFNYHVPDGEFMSFLLKNGAGPRLQDLHQILTSYSASGDDVYFNYAMCGIPFEKTGTLEAGSWGEYAGGHNPSTVALPLWLGYTELNGKKLYSPGKTE